MASDIVPPIAPNGAEVRLALETTRGLHDKVALALASLRLRPNPVAARGGAVTAAAAAAAAAAAHNGSNDTVALDTIRCVCVDSGGSVYTSVCCCMSVNLARGRCAQ
jgi:hypothetical protein